MRALLVYNPEASGVSPGVREVIARALSAETKLEVVQTKRRGHAMHIAAGAVHEGLDLVACLGGDGTLNEVINGLAGSPVALAPLPGGGTNVFARTLGLPRDPIEALAAVLQRIREGVPPRQINLGVCNGRRFAFCAGVGFDGAVVRAVERRSRLRRHVGDWLFVSTALRVFFFAYDRRNAPITLRVGDQETTGIFLAIVGKSNPYTYLGARPFQLCPAADPDRGLDITAFRTMRTAPVLRVIWRAFGTGGHVNFRRMYATHDVDRFEITADRPVPYQLDGDYLGEGTRFAFDVDRDALTVMA